MFWRKKQRNDELDLDIEMTRQAIREQELELELADDKEAEARAIRRRLQILREHNHFAEKIEAALFPVRGRDLNE